LARDSRQLLWPEQQQGQHKQNCGVGKTHVLMITERMQSGNAEPAYISEWICRMLHISRFLVDTLCRDAVISAFNL
jgi:hypothetical protein